MTTKKSPYEFEIRILTPADDGAIADLLFQIPPNGPRISRDTHNPRIQSAKVGIFDSGKKLVGIAEMAIVHTVSDMVELTDELIPSMSDEFPKLVVFNVRMDSPRGEAALRLYTLSLALFLEAKKPVVKEILCVHARAPQDEGQLTKEGYRFIRISNLRVVSSLAAEGYRKTNTLLQARQPLRSVPYFEFTGPFPFSSVPNRRAGDPLAN